MLLHPVLWLLMPSEELVAVRSQHATKISRTADAISGPRRQTRSHTITSGRDETMHHTIVGRSAHADQLEAEVRDARCCDAVARCPGCVALLTEVRAARRDAVLHSIASIRPRRALR